MDTKIAAPALAGTGAKTVLLVLGASSKGLGAAGISAQGEIDRTNLLIAEAKKQGIKIIGLHIGGKSRRGEMSDEAAWLLPWRRISSRSAARVTSIYRHLER